MAMMGTSQFVEQTDALSDLLKIVADPKAYTERLETLRATTKALADEQKKLDKARVAARDQAKQAGEDAAKAEAAAKQAAHDKMEATAYLADAKDRLDRATQKETDLAKEIVKFERDRSARASDLERKAAFLAAEGERIAAREKAVAKREADAAAMQNSLNSKLESFQTLMKG